MEAEGDKWGRGATGGPFLLLCVPNPLYSQTLDQAHNMTCLEPGLALQLAVIPEGAQHGVAALRDLCQALGFKVTLRTNPSAQVGGSPKLVVLGRKGTPALGPWSSPSWVSPTSQAGSASVSLASDCKSDFLLYSWDSHFLALESPISKTETEDVLPAP